MKARGDHYAIACAACAQPRFGGDRGGEADASGGSPNLGSVRLVINASTGTTLQRIDYDDWGTPTYVTGSVNDQPFAFAGGLWDPDTKLLHLGAREYDPEVRRFLTRDPSGFAGGWNLYGYAWNDPVNYVDPDGNVPWLAAAAAGAAFGAASDIALQLALNGGNFDCLDWGEVGVAAGLGAVGGGVGGLVKAGKAGSALQRVLYGSRTDRVFWTYGGVNGAAARNAFRTGRALEQTLAGRVLTAGNRVGLGNTRAWQKLWVGASRGYAGGARGSVRAYVGGPHPYGVWNKVEKPALSAATRIQTHLPVVP